MSEYGLTMGTADVRSAGPVTFGPDGILFLADNVSAKIFALDVADPGRDAGAGMRPSYRLPTRIAGPSSVRAMAYF